MSNMASNLWNLNWKDLGRGLVSAVVVGVLAALVGIVGNGFNLFTADWISIFQNMVNSGFIALVGYLGTQLLSDNNQKVLGKM